MTDTYAISNTAVGSAIRIKQSSASLNRDLPALTGCRFFAALWVLLLHTSTLIQLPEPIRAIALQGRAGVSFFFILSGFILTHTYGDRFREKAEHDQKRRFWVHRAARIYPLHVLTLLIITPISLILFSRHYSAPTLGLSWLANLALVQNYFPSAAFGQIWNAPAWSICCEFAFYAAFPTLIYSIHRRFIDRRQWTLPLVLCYFSTVVLFALGFLFWKWRGASGVNLQGCMDFWVYRNPLCRLGEFALGCVLYSAITSQGNRFSALGETAHGRNLLILFALIWLFILAAVCTLFELSGSPWATFLRSACWYVLPAPAMCLLIVALARGPSRLTAALTAPIILLLGESSYAIYMLHWTVWGMFTAKRDLPIEYLSVALVLIVPVSVFVFRNFECPARIKMRRLLNA